MEEVYELSVLSQGHLRMGRLLSGEATLSPPINVEKGRRKIYNHQFFGYCKILWLGGEKWGIYIPNGQGVKVVSPDHLDSPLMLGEGWWVATHPTPLNDID